MGQQADSPTVVPGVVFTIEYAVCLNGSMPARQFIESLSAPEQRKLEVLLRKMANQGIIRNTDQFKFVKGEIFEFKRHQLRVFCFRRDNRWFLTNGYKKKRKRLDREEIKRAERVMAEHLKREAGKEGRRTK